MLDLASGRTLPAPSRADRKIATSSKGHCTAHLVLGQGDGVRVQAESHLESCLTFIVNARREVANFQEQAAFSYGVRDEHTHFFDLLATLRAGTRIAFTIKPEARLNSGGFLEKMQIVTWWVRKKEFADQVRLLTDADIDRTELHNAKLFAAVRRGDPEADERAENVASSLTGARTLRDLTAQTGLTERGYRALLRLIRAGTLCPCNHEPITSETLVYSKGMNQ